MANDEGRGWASNARGTLNKAKRHFLTRTATDDAEQLLRRTSMPELRYVAQNGQTQPFQTTGQSTARDSLRQSYGTLPTQHDSRVQHDEPSNTLQHRTSSQSPKKAGEKPFAKPEQASTSTVIAHKLGTFTGVFVPTSLNVFSILMFIRFGFVLGQGGVVGTLVMLLVAYAINLVTTLSISAVASNGTVRGGGAYYLISRSLGPEFGGSIGIISYLGYVFNTGMNAVGLVDCLIYNFGSEEGVGGQWLPEGGWWPYLWSSIVLLICVVGCLAGSAIFTKASNGLLLILMLSILSIPVSALLRSPFSDNTGPQPTEFTGFSLATLKENLLPHLTRGAAGSQIKGRENFQDLFGILFPATGGIFAGASMSGDLRNPSKAIPRGTLYGILVTFVFYTIVILSMAATITRATLYKNVNVVQDINLSFVCILCGEMATCLFSVLMGIIGPAKQLQAIGRDAIFPGLNLFGRGTAASDDPIGAILLTWGLAQLTLFFNINSIASLVTMSYLLTSLSLHLACLLLKLSSAPNFRPSFHYFNQWTALVGVVLSIASMVFVDQVAAAASIVILMAIFLIIHYTTPPKPWGADVTSGLVYHQIRKYLLRLKTEHVKYWRPQILLFVNDPRRGYKLVQFANSLKKGGLFILGHVIVTENFGASVPEARRQQAAWMKYIEYMKIKAFLNVAISPSIEWGARNIVLSAGLGGMRPNIVMMGFYNLDQFRQEQPLVDVPSPPPERKRLSQRSRRRSLGEVRGSLPTDICYVEKRTDMQSYVLVLEDMILKLKTNVAVAVNFSHLELPNLKEGNSRKYIDLWPIQMSAEIPATDGGTTQNILTTNFDTYTMILQLGCILNTVPAWKKSFTLRVAVFVEYETDVEEEGLRVKSLLDSLRIEAEVLVFWLARGDLKSYELIVNGADVDEESEANVNKVLEDEAWWTELSKVRGKVRSGDMSTADLLSFVEDSSQWPVGSIPGRRESSAVRFDGLRRILQGSRYRPSFSRLSQLGVSLNIRTHRLDNDLISRHASHHSESADSVLDSDDTEASHEADGGLQSIDVSADESDQSREFAQTERSQKHTSTNLQSKQSSSKKSSLASSKKSKQFKKQRASAPSSLSEARASPKGFIQARSFDYDADGESQGPRGRRLQRLDDEDEYRSASLGSFNQSVLAEEDRMKHLASSGSFTSAPVPPTKVSEVEGQGPSIMFEDSPHPRWRNRKIGDDGEPNTRSIYQRTAEHSQDSRTKTAQGFPSAAAVPLSFNDLPSRAQHLILNELMSQYSDETAVIFTTLPAPDEGTYKNESDSLTYLTDLEVLTQGLGPVLLVHSNSMTVTTNL